MVLKDSKERIKEDVLIEINKTNVIIEATRRIVN